MRTSSQQLSAAPTIEQLSGEGKGATFELMSDRITIGRSDNNDVVLPSEAVSRFHASIERDPEGGFLVKDHQSKNGVQVNGITVQESSLRNGDLVQIGTFMFRFHAPIGSELPEVVNERDPGVGYPAAPIGRKPISVGGNRRLMIYGGAGLLLLLVYFVNSDEKKPTVDVTKPETELKLPQPTPPPPLDLSAGPAKSVPGQEDPLLKGGGDEDRQKRTNDLKEAEQNFKKGLREFTNENYHRAVEYFRLALTMNRQHELADYYLKLTYFELETQANKNFEIGRKYFEAMNYSRAIYHFGEVIRLLNHRQNDKRSADAEQFIAAAKKRLQEAQQFP